MSSGNKELVVNNLERAVSVDINRMQKFRNKDAAELWKFMLDYGMSTDDLDAAGVMVQVTTQNSPVNAEIINGLCVKPNIGTLDLFVDPGLVYLLNPDAAADDSNYKFVNDAGIGGTGVLAMTANSSGSTRIDVIECQNAQNANAETDNRDIFNPSTGTFTATTVSKATQAQLSYRVRAGTPGAGFPGTAAGWLPLAVASVPTGTTTNDTITFWDVRPLVGDRAHQPVNLALDMPRATRGTHAVVNTRASAGKALMNGLAEYIVGNRRLGGRLRRGTPDTLASVNSVDLNDSANFSSGFSYTASQLYYVYLLTPFGLPRWARYYNAADGGGSRLPRSPRGIVVVSSVAPNHMYGTPSAAVNLPTSTGLLGNTTSGVCIEAALATGGAAPASAVLGTVWNHDTSSGTLAATTFTAPTGGAGIGATALFTVLEGAFYPANARALWVKLRCAYVVNSGQYASFQGGYVQVQDHAGNLIATIATSDVFPLGNPTGIATGSGNYAVMLRVPVPTQYPTTPGLSWSIFWNTGYVNIGTNNATGATIEILGWECTP